LVEEESSFDFFGRRGVDSSETVMNLSTNDTSTFKPLDKGRENESAVFVTANRNFGEWSLHGGARWNKQSQSSDDSNSISDLFTTYFITAKKQWGNYNFTLNYGTGFRFASLSERLFNGTTGRGQTIGNPNLRPEKSTAFDLGIGYEMENINFQTHWFKTKVSDFIERIKISDHTRSFENVTSGDIQGLQYKVVILPDDEFSIEFSGQIIKGKNSNNQSMTDIPPNRHGVSVGYYHHDWYSRMVYFRRMKKDDFGDGEIPLKAANLLSLKTSYDFSTDWRIQLSVENLMDEKYFGSADDLSTIENGRTINVNLYYN